MAKFSALVSIISLLPFVVAQSQEWASTSVSGTTCTFMNDFYSQVVSWLPATTATTPPSTPTAPASPTAPAGSGLNTIAKADAGKLYFGSATDNSELTDTAYIAILKNNPQFGQITPANSMKWVNSVASTQIGAVLTTHVTTVVKPFNDDGTWCQYVIFNSLGSNYVSMALIAARAADPAAKLCINDYNMAGGSIMIKSTEPGTAQRDKNSVMTDSLILMCTDNVPAFVVGCAMDVTWPCFFVSVAF
ncbi:hypothetical protein C8R44DRAFT_734205 [Mycena epipterygia]|nr:hypothetical protein C8R44DRAFT_734205 [Mycena epipterygia]